MGTLLRDHLDDLGVTGVDCGPLDGHGPEGLEIAAPDGRILISTSTEVITVPLGTTIGLLAAHYPADPDRDTTLLHTTPETPVAAEDLAATAAKVAAAITALEHGNPVPAA
ncbi:hypothetical protein [Nocardiopsis sp. NPDC055824]